MILIVRSADTLAENRDLKTENRNKPMIHDCSKLNTCKRVLVVCGPTATGKTRLGIELARALGIKQRNIMWKHILPNVFNLVIVNISLGYASSLLTEAGLSFLNFGVAQPTPSWGNMLTSAQQSSVIQYYWWRWFLPGLFVVLAALSANLIGDALREAMDPRENER